MSRAGGIFLAIAIAISATTWLFAANRAELMPEVDFPAYELRAIQVSDAERAELMRQAGLRLAAPLPASPSPAFLACDYLPEPPSGTTPKFHCVLPDGEVIKVKYGRNPEIQSEVAASRLLAQMRYATDTVTIVPLVRCYGCPRYPFAAIKLRALPLGDRFIPERYDDGYSDFTQVAVERKFPAPAIKTATTEGWSWFELKDSRAPVEEVDAFRLLAAFLAHWDNKATNQRLVCLDPNPPHPPDPPQSPSCATPLLMIHDLGAVFGPYKANLSQWREARIWADAKQCVVSMETLPFGGSTFKEGPVSEEGRQRLLADLNAVTDADLREVFTAGAFGDYYAGTDDERDIRAWTAVFRHRVNVIAAAGPCPAASPSRPLPDSSSQS